MDRRLLSHLWLTNAVAAYAACCAVVAFFILLMDMDTEDESDTDIEDEPDTDVEDESDTDIEDEPIPREPSNHECVSESPVDVEGDSSSYAQTTLPPSNSSKKSRKRKYISKRDEAMRDAACILAKGLSEIADAIRTSCTAVADVLKASNRVDWRMELGEVIMNMEGFDKDDLDAVYKEMVTDENKALAFLSKKPHRQLKFVVDRIEWIKAQD